MRGSERERGMEGNRERGTEKNDVDPWRNQFPVTTDMKSYGIL